MDCPRPVQSLTPTLNQVRKQLGMALNRGDDAAPRQQQQLGSADAAAAAAASTSSGSRAAVSNAPRSRAAEVASQAESAAREVAVSRRQADAQQWISEWRSRSRGNRKAAAAKAYKDDRARRAAAPQPDLGDLNVSTEERLAQVTAMVHA